MYVVTVCVCIQSNSEYDLSKIPMQRWYKLTTKKYWSGLISNPFQFPRLKTWKTEYAEFFVFRFPRFYPWKMEQIGKWNRLEIEPAYVTRHFNSFPDIY